MRGAADERIAKLAIAERRCIVTLDFDFADIRVYPPGEYFGIVVVEPPDGCTVRMIQELVVGVVTNATVLQELSGSLAVVQPGRIRIRRSSR